MDANVGTSFTRYAYANNNPFKYVDPDGRDAADKFGDQFKRDAEAGNTKVYEPLVLPAAVVTGGMLVGPVIAAVANPATTAVAVSGAYRIVFKSGREYIGKGLKSRMERSVARLEKKHGDVVESTEYTTATSHREDFKEESRQIDASGGAQKQNPSTKLYNEIESPGKKMRIQDGEIK